MTKAANQPLYKYGYMKADNIGIDNPNNISPTGQLPSGFFLSFFPGKCVIGAKPTPFPNAHNPLKICTE